MAIRGFFEGAQPYFIGIGMPVVAVLLGVIVPTQISQAQLLGKLDGNVDTLKSGQQSLSDKLDGVSARLAASESDPGKLMSKLLGVSALNADVATVAFINGKLIAFPKRHDSESRFANAGYKLEYVTPTMAGYDMSVARPPEPLPLAPPHD